MLPEKLIPALKEQLEKAKAIHDKDLSEGFGKVFLPYALARKYPNASHEWKWQYVFPADRRSFDPRSKTIRRHHFIDNTLQKVVKRSVRQSGINKKIGCHTFRHYAEFRIMPSKFHTPSLSESNFYFLPFEYSA